MKVLSTPTEGHIPKAGCSPSKSVTAVTVVTVRRTTPANTVTTVTTDTLRLALKPTDAEVLEFITKSPDDCLQYRNSDGSIDLDGVREMMVDIERKKIIDDHPYSISQGNDGRWRTWVKDENAKAGRKQIVKSTREKLENALVE